MPATPASHRREKRAQSSRQGSIKLGFLKSIRCTIEDLSSSGAKLVLPDEMTLPSEFKLVVTGTGKKRTHRCANRWQDGKTIGVEILSTKLG